MSITEENIGDMIEKSYLPARTASEMVTRRILRASIEYFCEKNNFLIPVWED